MTIVWHWPQITVVIILVTYLGLNMVSDGEPIKAPQLKYNAWMAIFRTSFWLTLLYFGGFFAGASP